MSPITLTVTIHSYWHPGSGRGQGALLDANAQRDSDGLPVLPGRHLKGLLREALAQADTWGWDGYQDLAAQYFGERPEDRDREHPVPGTLRISDAALPRAEANWLASAQGRHLLPGLFRPLYATAIDHHSGTASDQSLRGLEVVVPLTLYAQLEPVPGRPPPDATWVAQLTGVLPLISAVGAHRSRGLGRAVLSMQETP